MLLYFVFICIGTLVSSFSQVLLKKAALKKRNSVIREYFNFEVISAYVLFLFSTFLTILAYKKLPLSLGNVLETTGYLYIVLWGKTVFNESISKRRMVALLLIIVGIIIYSFG